MHSAARAMSQKGKQAKGFTEQHGARPGKHTRLNGGGLIMQDFDGMTQLDVNL